MKKLSLLAILLLVSCAEEIPESPELRKCIDANISLLQTGVGVNDVDKLVASNQLHKLIIKFDFDTFMEINEALVLDMPGSTRSDDLSEKISEFNYASFLAEEGQQDDDFYKNYKREFSQSLFNEIKEEGYIESRYNIKTDAEETYFTYSYRDKENVTLKQLTDEFEGYYYIPEARNFVEKSFASTLKLKDKNILKDIAQNICWSQGIY